MPLTTVLITIVAAGLLLWLVNRFIPMQGQIKSILNGLVVIVLVLWIANLYGLFRSPPSIPRRALTSQTIEGRTASPANLRQQRNTAVF